MPDGWRRTESRMLGVADIHCRDLALKFSPVAIGKFRHNLHVYDFTSYLSDTHHKL